ncbi:MAG: hypothetical protein GY708_26525 [Actinomycetia bacterium]|nr:hypothetical protein [Actinomycetes bacterium]
MTIFRTLALAAALALLAAACGDSSDQTNAESNPSTSVAAAQSDEMADEMADDEMADDEMADDEMADEMADDEMADEMADDEMADEMADDEMAMMGTTFTVHVENVSDGSDTPTPFAPVVAVTGHGPNPIFAVGDSMKAVGLEQLAEDGDPSELVLTVDGVVAAVPDSVAGSDDAMGGPAFPGDGYLLTVEGHEGDSLSLAFMYVQSNDWFLAIDTLALFSGGMPLDGDISEYVMIYDAGTEIDQPIGEGADQAPRQAAPGTGADDPDETVRLVGPATGLVKVTIHAGDMMNDDMSGMGDAEMDEDG